MASVTPSMTTSSSLRVALTLSLVAIAILGCAKEETKEQHLSRSKRLSAAEQYEKAREGVSRSTPDCSDWIPSRSANWASFTLIKANFRRPIRSSRKPQN